MAASFSELAATLRSTSLEEYAWWKHHAAFYFSLMFAFTMLVLYFGLKPVLSSLGVASVLQVAMNWLLRATFVVVLLTSITSWLGYYYDAKYVRSLDVDYTPNWKLYMVLHLTLPIGGPLFAVPLYTFQRFRHVGLPVFG
ncbi:hypothetical protein [Halapricum hydrolyticum]|uniref:Uncharacterized protein n=1 Tax=Halapricum hydrolyticum TaxID=2979991 RepID=A0AAE3LFB0_9EURY|nr:hypothetical protein [Halapricum hydrolyticum]MCU4717975.1 hypothetical protein [Halapricum hydrolyticum]MCU4727140.1 hypothetical protein [Halapricum hydrolyticum]